MQFIMDAGIGSPVTSWLREATMSHLPLMEDTLSGQYCPVSSSLLIQIGLFEPLVIIEGTSNLRPLQSVLSPVTDKTVSENMFISFRD